MLGVIVLASNVSTQKTETGELSTMGYTGRLCLIKSKQANKQVV